MDGGQGLGEWREGWAEWMIPQALWQCWTWFCWDCNSNGIPIAMGLQPALPWVNNLRALLLQALPTS